MKKALQLVSIFLLVLIFVFTVYLAFVSLAVSADTSFENSESFLLLKEFVTDNPNRVSGTSGEKAAKDWLKNKLVSFGFVEGNITEQKIQNLDSYNLIATIDNASTNNQIVIGAHYDSVSESVGASDNASGVVALLKIAKQLFTQKSSLNFDLTFVFFGSEEEGLLGSMDFVKNNDTTNTLLMVNIDSIALGDKLYIHSEAVATKFQRAFVDGAVGSPTKLLNKPLGSGIFMSFDYWGYGYYELAQMSDHTSFRLAGVPTVFFFSGNYQSLFLDYVESTDTKFRVINTSKDTLALVTERGAEAVAKIDTVVQSATKTLTNQSNVETFLNARSELVDHNVFNIYFVYGMLLLLLLIAAAIGLLYYKKLQKQAILGTAEVKQTKSIFSSPNAESVFDLDKKEKEEKTKQSSDVDDVFKF